MFFSFIDVQSFFQTKLLAKARLYLDQSRVTKLRVVRQGEIITAVVGADSGVRSRVYVRVDSLGQAIVFHGECSCDVGQNCVHVVAALLKGLLEIGEFPVDQTVKIASQVIPLQTHQVNTKTSPVPPIQVPSMQVPSDTEKETTKNNKQHLVYILIASENDYDPRLKTGVVRNDEIIDSDTRQGVGPDTRAVDITFFDPSYAARTSPARFLQAADFQILRQIDKLARDPTTGFPRLTSLNMTLLFNDLIATGRFYFMGSDDYLVGAAIRQPLQLGEVKDLVLTWKMNKRAAQSLTWETDSDAKILFFSQLWYVQPTTNCCGPLNTVNSAGNKISLTLAKLFFDNTPLPPESDKLLADWESNYGNLSQFGLIGSQIKWLEKTKPNPCIRLRSIILNKHKPCMQNILEFSLDYCGIRIKREDPNIVFDGKQVYQISRDLASENKFAKLLTTLGLMSSAMAIPDEEFEIFMFKGRDSNLKWVNLQLENFPQMRELGWRIVVDDDFHAIAVDVDRWHCIINESQQPDWFELGIGAEVDGEKIDLVPALLRLMETYPQGFPEFENCPQHFTLALDDGRLLRVAAERLRTIYNTLLEFFNTNDPEKIGKLSLSRIQLARIATLEKKGDKFLTLEAKKETLRFLQQLQATKNISLLDVPKGLQAELRPYQKSGFEWLQFLRQYHLAGILADDMGLGKTLQTLTHLLMEKEQGRLLHPALIIVPTSLLFNWHDEVKKFTPSLSVLTLHGNQRQALFSTIPEFDIVLTTYPLIYRDLSALLETEYHSLILDEAQAIKNPKTRVSIAVREIRAVHRICLTGTPMENHLGELWSLFDFLMPGFLGPEHAFQQQFRTPIENQGNEERADQLSRLVRPFLMRRTKQAVAPELPNKTEITIKAEFDGPQRELYEGIRLAMHEHVKQEIKRLGIGRSHIVVLNALLKLRQICCDPQLLVAQEDNYSYDGKSAKSDLLMSMVTEMIEEGRQILIFSQFTTMLSLIGDRLTTRKIPYLLLTGQSKNRGSIVSGFQNKDVQILMISLKAGGVGLNLTAADTVIHYDPWWNPAVEQQATARAHRIGQNHPVFVYKLICRDTVEEKIQQMQEYKQAVVESLYDTNGGSEAKWTQGTIDELFSMQ